VKAIVLAAGYATRLRPLTDNVAKPLLPVGGRPMLDWLVDKIEEVDEIDHVHVVTNARYAGSFREWTRGREGIEIHDDGTTSNEDRLGAIGDIGFVVDRAGIDDDLIVIAGDNLFDFSLSDYVDYWRSKGEASGLAVYDVGSRELASQYGIVDVEDDGRIVEFIEKPPDPHTTLAATANYIYHRAHVPLVAEYLAGGNNPDQPGNLVAWLHKRRPVYAYEVTGEWLDIGTPGQLLEADNRWRERAGLPTREEYSLQP
jgi:glucose-1-phosphate thymidylyltransferase